MTSRRAILSLCGFIALLVLAEVAGQFNLLGDGWPPLTEVLSYLKDPDTGGVVLDALGVTLIEAGTGFVIGSVVAVALGLTTLLLPPLQPGIDRLAAIVNSIPLIALGPILFTTVGPGASPTIIATMSAGFVVFVAATSGVGSVPPALTAMFAALGSSRLKQVVLLSLPHAVPTLIDGVCLAAPAAVLGAILGEWFGADQGIGVMLIGAMQSFNVDELWSAALVASAASLVCYLILSRVRTLAHRRFG